MEADKITSSDMRESAQKIHPGGKRLRQEEEQFAVQFIEERRNVDLALNPLLVAAATVAQFPESFDSVEQCRFWVYSIMDRNNLSIRRKTTDAKSLTEEELMSSKIDFVQEVRNSISFHDYPLKYVINMDETGSHFDITPNSTIARRGSKRVSVQSSNSSNACSIFLAVALDGSKLKPFVVFKGKKDGNLAKGIMKSNLDQRNHYAFQKSGWCDTDTMIIWAKTSLADHLKDCNTPSLLMMDNFSVHQTGPVKEALAELGTSVMYLPPNTTSVTQILDVGVNKQFKGHLQQFQMSHLVQTFEKSGGKVKITRELMSKMIADAWDLVTPTAVTNTARKIGFIDQ